MVLIVQIVRSLHRLFKLAGRVLDNLAINNLPEDVPAVSVLVESQKKQSHVESPYQPLALFHHKTPERLNQPLLDENSDEVLTDELATAVTDYLDIIYCLRLLSSWE